MTTLGHAIFESLNNLATFFGWCILILILLGLISLGPAELVRQSREARCRKRAWKRLAQVRREFELDELKGATAESQTARWEYVWPGDAA